jgi:hypothetical protein
VAANGAVLRAAAVGDNKAGVNLVGEEGETGNFHPASYRDKSAGVTPPPPPTPPTLVPSVTTSPVFSEVAPFPSIEPEGIRKATVRGTDASLRVPPSGDE